MPELFKRSVAVTIDTLEFRSLEVAFKIEKTLKSEPNTCEVRVWNLSEDHRSALEELRPKTKGLPKGVQKSKGTTATKGIPTKIEAGYGEDLSQLWLGDLRTVNSTREGADWITALESGDGEKAWQNARLHVSYGPQTPVETALRAMVRALGIGEGNLAQVVARLKVTGVGRLFPHGTVISGSVARELTDFCRSADLEWSIQDGAVQFVDRGKALAQTALRLTSDTGLIGSPTVDNDGILSARMLMIPDVRPGRLLVLDASRVKGNYRIEKATWTGDTAGTDWYIDVEAKRY